MSVSRYRTDDKKGSNLFHGDFPIFATNMSFNSVFRIEKEKNALQSDNDELVGNLETLEKQKVALLLKVDDTRDDSQRR